MAEVINKIINKIINRCIPQRYVRSIKNAYQVLFADVLFAWLHRVIRNLKSCEFYFVLGESEFVWVDAWILVIPVILVTKYNRESVLL